MNVKSFVLVGQGGSMGTWYVFFFFYENTFKQIKEWYFEKYFNKIKFILSKQIYLRWEMKKGLNNLKVVKTFFNFQLVFL